MQAERKEMLHVCALLCCRRWVSPAGSQRLALPLTLWQLPPGIASSLVLPEPADGCGQLPGTWVARPWGHARPPHAPAGHEHWALRWVGEGSRIWLHQYGS